MLFMLYTIFELWITTTSVPAYDQVSLYTLNININTHTHIYIYTYIYIYSIYLPYIYICVCTQYTPYVQVGAGSPLLLYL